MALVCDRCGKGVLNGNLVSHSNIKTKRKFRPNLQTVWMSLCGKRVRTKLCTKCMKLMKKVKAFKESKAAKETPRAIT